MSRLTAYPITVITALDRLANAILLGDGRTTISTRAYEATLKGERWGCWLCGVLDRLQQDHCRRSAEFDAALKLVLDTGVAQAKATLAPDAQGSPLTAATPSGLSGVKQMPQRRCGWPPSLRTGHPRGWGWVASLTRSDPGAAWWSNARFPRI